MEPKETYSDIQGIFDDLATDAGAFFARASAALYGYLSPSDFPWPSFEKDQNRFWRALPDELQAESRRLTTRLLPIIGKIAAAIARTPLASDSDLQALRRANQAMRGSLMLRHFQSSDITIIHDVGTVLGSRPASQSDDEPLEPQKAADAFVKSKETIDAVLALLATSPRTALKQSASRQ